MSIYLDGQDVTDAFARIPHTRKLEGVVTGLDPGDNLLEVEVNRRGRSRKTAELVLTNYDIAGPAKRVPNGTSLWGSSGWP